MYCGRPIKGRNGKIIAAAGGLVERRSNHWLGKIAHLASIAHQRFAGCHAEGGSPVPVRPRRCGRDPEAWADALRQVQFSWQRSLRARADQHLHAQRTRQSIPSTLRPASAVRPICRPAHSDPDPCLTTMGQMPYGWMRQQRLSSVHGQVRPRRPAANTGTRVGVVAAYEVFRSVTANAPSGAPLELSAPTRPTAPA
jgi:hypothetical protein